MSSIDEMKILGVRSFGIQEEDRQLIEFEHPLTLIVGKNGAGKTTIIECLKYATTGDLPLNTKDGGFVHDTKLVEESVVPAQVTLKFNDIKGQTSSVERSLQVTLKGGKRKRETLDSKFERKSVGGEMVSASLRCGDINTEMVDDLGVSKAVLKNVIFCHQEDSNWPLAESNTVKTRFDEIFASTRHIAALHNIKQIKKELEKSHQQEKIKLPFLEKNLEASKGKQKNLEDEEMKLQVAEESAKKAADEIIPINKQLKEKQKQKDELTSMKSSLQREKDRKENVEKDIETREKRIQNIFGGSDAQLQQMIRNQENLMAQKKANLDDFQRQVEPVKEDIETLSKENSSLLIKQGALQQEYETFEGKKSDRTTLISRASGRFGVPCEYVSRDEVISENGATEFEKEIKKLVENTEKTVSNKKKRSDEDIEQKSKEIQKIWGTKTEIEEGLNQKLQTIKEKTQKIRYATQEIEEMQSSADADRLEELQRDLEKSSDALKTAEESFNINELKEKEKKLEKVKTQREIELKQIDGEILSMRQHEQSRTTIRVFKEEKADKLESVKKIKHRNLDSLSSINILNPGDDIDSPNFPSMKQMNNWINRKTKEEESMRKELDKKKQELTKLTTEYEILTSDFEQKKKRLKEIEDEMFELCGSEEYEHELTQSEATIHELQQGKGVNDGVEYLYKEFLKKLRSSDDKSATPCPLCHRLFDQISEVDELAQEIDQKLQMAPRKRIPQAQDLKGKKKRHEFLLQQKPAKEEMDKLKSEILPEMEDRVKKIKARISTLRHTISEKEEEIARLSNDSAIVQSCLSDICQLENIMLEINDRSRKISIEEAKLPSSGNSGKTIEALDKEKRELSDAVAKYTKALKEIQEERESKTGTLMRLKDNLINLLSEKLKIAANVEKWKQLNESKKQLEGEVKTLQASCEEANSKITPLKTQLESMEEEKRQLMSQLDSEMQVEQKKWQSLQSAYRDILRANSEIQMYSRSGNQQLLERTREALKKIEEDLGQKENELGKLRDEISWYEKDLSTCRDRRRDLDENVALQAQKKNREEVISKIDRIKEKLSDLDQNQLEHEIQKLQETWHKLNREKEIYSERQNLLKISVKALKDELAKDDYKHADERFRDCKRKVTTTDLAMKDLEKYHRALDRAIMRFHAVKMFEVNKIIKEIWMNTYCGQDIDYIEICSDEDIRNSKMGRRNYNYRLVKCSRGQKIDMRGRCSAGQKVLASLVIRLALAETFCINCGILALDEPTTNLDRHHIETLADALSKIIESRQAQRNFRLIVITHDEHFVDLLGRSNRVDHYFRVLKEDGKSRIHKCAIETLE